MRVTERIHRKSEGFSLVEVMVAIVILTVGLLSLAQMMVIATNSNSLSGRMTSCSGLAKEQLERLKSAPFYTNPQAFQRNPLLDPSPEKSLDETTALYSKLYDPEGHPEEDPNYAGALFEVRWNITDVVTNLPLQMIRIQVRCLPAAGMQDQFAVIGEARFTTFRSANVG